MARKIGLVTASRHERGTICRASEQYDTSPIFRRARDYCVRTFGEWYIVSVRLHLLSPQRVIGPGERALLSLNAEERTRWAALVAHELCDRASRSAEPTVYVLYASQRCADALMRAAPNLTFELPLSGMSLRERLHWYDERLAVRSRVLTRPLRPLPDSAGIELRRALG
ncbi:MAG: DUF6884 domain-containing protein [Ktedonobacterales bacterium]